MTSLFVAHRHSRAGSPFSPGGKVRMRGLRAVHAGGFSEVSEVRKPLITVVPAQAGTQHSKGVFKWVTRS